MNRLPSTFSDALEASLSAAAHGVPMTHGGESSVAAAVHTIDDDTCCHALFAPLHYEAKYSYPLLVWLHAGRRDERQLARVMPHVSMRNYVAVAPRGTQPVDEEADDDSAGFRWRQTGNHVYLAEQRVMECVALARRRYHVNPSRVFLAGVGSGGTMALRLAMSHPDRFAGAASVNGGLPRGMSPLARLNEARRNPVLLIAGLNSRRYTQDKIDQDLRLLHAANIVVQLRLYPHADEIALPMLADIDRWIMKQVCPTS